MFPEIDAAAPGQRLSENVMHFARLLRGAGMRLGPDRVVDCVKALELADCNRRDDWYWTMSSVFISKEEQRPIFDQAFRIFWRDPKLVEKMMNALLPKTYGRAGKPEQEQSQRLSDALFDQKKAEKELKEQEIDLDARLTFSSKEVLQRMDFDTMSAAELAEAKKMLRELRLPLPLIRTRRNKLNANGKKINLRATLRWSRKPRTCRTRIRRSTSIRPCATRSDCRRRVSRMTGGGRTKSRVSNSCRGSWKNWAARWAQRTSGVRHPAQARRAHTTRAAPAWGAIRKRPW